MHVALTGASGFVGTAVAERLLEDGCTVVGLTRGGRPLPPGVAPVHGDIGDAAAVARLVAGADAVIHAAGLVRSHDEAELRRVNVDGARVVARVVAPQVRLVHISTAGVHGRPGGVVTEASPVQPPDAYERSKAAAEAHLHEVRPAARVLRPTNVLGRGHPLDPLVRFLRSVRSGHVVVGRCAWTNYVPVNAVARAAVAAMTDDDAPSVTIVNHPLLLGDLVEAGAAAMGLHRRARCLPSALARILEPAARLCAHRRPSIGRLHALVDTTRFESDHASWIAAQGITTDLQPTLDAMVADYRERGLL